MTESLERSYVHTNPQYIATFRLFKYGGLWRIQYVKVVNDANFSRLLESFDKDYPAYEYALFVYVSLVAQVVTGVGDITITKYGEQK